LHSFAEAVDELAPAIAGLATLTRMGRAIRSERIVLDPDYSGYPYAAMLAAIRWIRLSHGLYQRIAYLKLIR
jgi:hypothetical protein